MQIQHTCAFSLKVLAHCGAVSVWGTGSSQAGAAPGEAEEQRASSHEHFHGKGWFLLGGFAFECAICILLVLWPLEVLRKISFPEITQIGDVLEVAALGLWLGCACLSYVIFALLLNFLYPLLIEVLVKSNELFSLISVWASPYSFDLSCFQLALEFQT